MDENNNRNFFLAIALSMLILVGWQYFYAGPMMEKERLRQEQLRKDSQAAGGGTAATTETGAGTLPETGAGASSGGTAGVPGASVGATATREGPTSFASCATATRGSRRPTDPTSSIRCGWIRRAPTRRGCAR